MICFPLLFHLEAILRYSGELAYLKLIDCPNLSNEFFSVLKEYNSNLIALTIIQCHGLTESKWGFFEPFFETTFECLERVRIEDNLELERISLRAPGLKRLKIDKNPKLVSYIINNEKTEFLDYLMKNYPEQASLKEKDQDGNIPLFWAMKNGKMEMLAYLIALALNSQIKTTQLGLTRMESERKEWNEETVAISADNMHLFYEMISSLISKIAKREIKMARWQEDIPLIKKQLEKVRAARNSFIYNETIPSLKDIAEDYKERKLTESERDELLQDRREALIPFNDKIKE